MIWGSAVPTIVWSSAPKKRASMIAMTMPCFARLGRSSPARWLAASFPFADFAGADFAGRFTAGVAAARVVLRRGVAIGTSCFTPLPHAAVVHVATIILLISRAVLTR